MNKDYIILDLDFQNKKLCIHFIHLLLSCHISHFIFNQVNIKRFSRHSMQIFVDLL